MPISYAESQKLYRERLKAKQQARERRIKMLTTQVKNLKAKLRDYQIKGVNGTTGSGDKETVG